MRNVRDKREQGPAHACPWRSPTSLTGGQTRAGPSSRLCLPPDPPASRLGSRRWQSERDPGGAAAPRAGGARDGGRDLCGAGRGPAGRGPAGWCFVWTLKPLAFPEGAAGAKPCWGSQGPPICPEPSVRGTSGRGARLTSGSRLTHLWVSSTKRISCWCVFRGHTFSKKKRWAHGKQMRICSG